MPALTNPAWWATLVGIIGGAVGLSEPLQADVKSVISGGVALVIAVYTWQHHKTVRNLDTATAAVQTAKAAVLAGHTVAGPIPGAVQAFPLPNVGQAEQPAQLAVQLPVPGQTAPAFIMSAPALPETVTLAAVPSDETVI